eukprot:7036183-Pyramimonas_sp.AAC.1
MAALSPTSQEAPLSRETLTKRFERILASVVWWLYAHASAPLASRTTDTCVRSDGPQWPCVSLHAHRSPPHEGMQ